MRFALHSRSLQTALLPPLSRVTMTLLATWSPAVHATWLPVFSLLIQQLPLSDIESICVPVVLGMGEPSQTVQTRTLACSLIGELSLKMGAKFRGEIWNRTRLLSQDPHFEVRKHMASQLPHIAVSVDRSIRPCVLDEVAKLLVDDEIEVSRVAAEYLSPVLECCDSVGLMRVVTEELIGSRDEMIVLNVANNSGKLLQCALRIPGCRYTPAIYEFYKSLVHSKNSAVQLAAAVNFPTVFNSRICTENTEGELLALFETLVMSVVPEVKVAIAQGVHEVLQHCTRPQSLQALVLSLLTDDTTKWVLAEHLSRIYAILKTDDNKAFWTAVQGLLQPTNWWRHISCTLREISSIRPSWSIREVLDSIQPSLFLLLQAGCWALRLQTLDLYVSLLHDNFYKARRVETCGTMVTSFAKAGSCFMRVLYVEFCVRVVKTHSKRFFEMYFFRPLLELKDDSITCVRIRLAEALPQIGKVFSGEESWTAEVSEAINQLSSDRDSEVQLRAHAALKEMSQKEYWEAARVVEAEEAVKLAREAAQDDLELAV